MKKRSVNSNNGITICDSIIMSVKRKKTDIRTPIAVAIAITGFVSVIMAFLGMFRLNYSTSAVAAAAVGFSLLYITLCVIEGKALWVYAGTFIFYITIAFRYRDYIFDGFRYVYNIIYRQTYHSDVDYYKDFTVTSEKTAVTVFMVFVIWLIAAVIYQYTICRPNPVLPLLVTFPLMEVGLYNGIAMPVFWGILVIAYWLALLSMSMIDVGEYVSGGGGFVRKDDTFFPKRQMKLKVTEQCGALVIACVMLIASCTAGYIKLTDYKRSEKLNQKRIDLNNAFNEFSFDDLPASLGRITEALGFDIGFLRDNDRLGSKDRVSYDNETDIVLTISDKPTGALYLKGDVSSVYRNSKWKELDSDVYKRPEYAGLFDGKIKPQDIFGQIAQLIYPRREQFFMTVKPRSSDPDFYAPYGTVNRGSLVYTDDTLVHSTPAKEQTYRMYYMSSTEVLDTLTYVPEMIYSYSDEITDNMARYYGSFEGYISCYDDIEAIDYEKKYRRFVYDNYLQIPDTKDMREVRNAYASEIGACNVNSTVQEKIQTLRYIKNRMSKDTKYTLSPGRTPGTRDFVSYFLLENQKGYCVHYATSGVMLARMAGIPARYATGYVVVDSDYSEETLFGLGSYKVNIKDSRSHAWTEVYLDGFGWVPFEFTTGYSENSITPGVEPKRSGTQTVTTTTAVTTTTVTGSNNYSTTTRTHTTHPVQSGTKPGTTAPHSSEGSSGGIPFAVKLILIILLFTGAVIGIIAARRRYIVSKRERGFTDGSPDQRIANIYAYAEKLLARLGIMKNDESYKDFAARVEAEYGGKLFASDGFARLIDISLGSAFSPDSASEEDIADCLSTVRAIAGSIYQKAGFAEKLSLKYLTVII